MQSFSYSVFSGAAIAIHLIINHDLLLGRKSVTSCGPRYRGFLLGILAYYIADASWGLLAGLGWTRLLYAGTIFFFLSMVVFMFMWGYFVSGYLKLGKWPSRVVTWSGLALLAVNLELITENMFDNCFFYFDEHGNYLLGSKRYLAFILLIAYSAMISVLVFWRAMKSRDSLRRQSLMAFLFCISTAAAIILQILWPLTPATALGCLIGNCFFHVFVIQDEQSTHQMTELEAALAHAHAADKARCMFFSIVSHDIRTPLNAILGYADLLQSGLKTEEERSEALIAIRESGTTLLQLVNDVLDLAKIDSGKMVLNLEPVRLTRLTESVFSSFRMAAEQKKLQLINQTDSVPKILLDEHRFRRVLVNLVGNAVKFTDEGSITVSAIYAGTDLEVSVSDTGCGIPQDMLEHILDPFVQVQDPSHSADRAGGTGLGLSICRGLVEAMGGKLTVKSRRGRGSTFTAYIPDVEFLEEKTAPSIALKQNAGPVKLPQHVLIVDDSPVNRAVLRSFLKKAEIALIDQACDGQEALQLLDATAKEGDLYDCVISDLWMPNMNGMEFIEKLRADARFRELPVIALTADTEYRRDARAYHFTSILLKPVTYDKLLDVFATFV